MSIQIDIVGDDLYRVLAIAPNDGSRWETAEPQSFQEILEALTALGYHTRDILEAFSAVRKGD